MAEQQVLNELARRLNVDLGKHRQSVTCPFHRDDRPSLSVYLTPRGQEHAHCFSCGFHGGIARLLAQIDGVSVSQKLHGLGVKIEPKVAVLESVVSIYAKNLETENTLLISGGSEIAAKFLTETRGHDLDLLKRMRIGVATKESNEKILAESDSKELNNLRLLGGRGKKKQLLVPVGAIIFPVIISGEVVAIRWKRYSIEPTIKKEVGQMAKEGWLRHIGIYNFDALKFEGNELFIVEGEDDALRLIKEGANAVAFIGSVGHRDKRFDYLRFSPAKKIIIAADNDTAGEQIKSRLIKYMRREKLSAWVYTPQMKDISDDLDMMSLETILSEAKEAIVEFREIQGAYWDGVAKLSTFVFDLRAKIIADNEIYLVVEVTGEKEPEPKTIIVPNRLIADKNEFNKFIKRQGCYAWLSTVGALDELVTKKWNDKMPVHYAINYIGFVDMSEYKEDDERRVHIMHDRLMLPDGTEKSSDGGVFWITDEMGLYLDVSDMFSFTTQGIIPSEDRLADLKNAMWNPEYMICLGWFLSIPWMEEIQKKLGGFPLLWLSGEKESGKTTFASFLMGLYYPLSRLKQTIDAFVSPGRTTPEGLSLALARYSGLPVLFDDLRSNSRYIIEYQEIMRILYDRFTIQKGRLRARDSLRQAHEIRKMRAALVVTSQHPPEDEALNQRTLEVDFRRTQLRNEVLFEMRALIKELYPIGLQLTLKSMNQSIGDELDEAIQILGPEAVSSRKLQAYAVGLAGLLKNGFSKEEAKKLMISLNVSHQSLISETDEIEDFFEYIRTAASSRLTDIQRFLGWRDSGYWIAPTQLYDLTGYLHRNTASFTKRSIKRLLKAQLGVKTFKTKHGLSKEKQVGVAIGDQKWTTVRAIFFGFQSDMGKRIKRLLGSGDDLFMDDEEPEVSEAELKAEESKESVQEQDAESDPFAGQF